MCPDLINDPAGEIFLGDLLLVLVMLLVPAFFALWILGVGGIFLKNTLPGSDLNPQADLNPQRLSVHAIKTKHGYSPSIADESEERTANSEDNP